MEYNTFALALLQNRYTIFLQIIPWLFFFQHIIYHLCISITIRHLASCYAITVGGSNKNLYNKIL